MMLTEAELAKAMSACDEVLKNLENGQAENAETLAGLDKVLSVLAAHSPANAADPGRAVAIADMQARRNRLLK